MAWGGISLDKLTDVFVLNRGIFVAQWYRDESLDTQVRLYAGYVGEELILMEDCAHLHTALVVQNGRIQAYGLTSPFPEINPIENM